MNPQRLHPRDLNAFVEETDRLGGPGTPAFRAWTRGFCVRYRSRVDRALDPFSPAYFDQQAALYTELSGRAVNQSEGERTRFDLDRHAAAANPYASHDVRFIARHTRAIQSALLLADLPPNAAVLDLGCGWGLSSETIAFTGARVTAVDIDPAFVELVRQRAARLGLPIEAVQSDFDTYTDDRAHDLLFFYECLHHALRPWETLDRLAPRVKPGGKIVWAGEPVNQHWWPHWGLRLDPVSVYCIRKHGWWESGWSAAFLARCFARCGFTLTLVPHAGLDGTAIGFAVRHADAKTVRPDRSALTPPLARRGTAAVVDRLRGRRTDVPAAVSWWLASPLRGVRRAARAFRR